MSIINGISDFEPNDENTFWMLIWHGKVSYNQERNRFEKKLFFITTKQEAFYDSKNWGSKTYSLKVSIGNAQLFSLGSVLNCNGHLVDVLINHYNLNNILSYSVLLNNEIGFKNNTSLSWNLRGSNYPNFTENEKLEQLPYYQARKKEESSIIDFYIPDSVIQEYFLTPGIIHALSKRKLEEIILGTKIEDGVGVIVYNGHNLNQNDLKKLAILLFMKDNSGIKMLEYISKNLFLKFINSEKRQSLNIEHYLEIKLPFNNLVKPELIGVLIDEKNDRGVISTKFLVFNILKIDYVNLKNIFEVTEFAFYNVNDKRKAEDVIDKDPIITNNPFSIDNMDASVLKNLSDLPSSSLLPSLKIEHPQIDTFSDLFKMKILDKKTQLNVYINNGIPFKGIDGCSVDIETSISSLKKKIEAINKLISEKDIYTEANIRTVELLRESGLKVKSLRLADNLGHFSLPPLHTKKPKKMLIYEIEFFNKRYCWIDGFEGTSIVLFRKVDGLYNFNEFNDPLIKEVLEFVIEHHDYSWASLFRTQRLLNLFQVVLLRPLDHKQPDTSNEDVWIEGFAQHLHDRIVSRIKKDKD